MGLCVFLAVTLLSGLLGIASFVIYLKKGQFDDCEDVKYQMFRDDEKGA